MAIGPEQERMLLARLDAIGRGDKALGRELYHQLQPEMAPHEIDAWRPGADPEPEPAPEPVAEPEPPVETADVPPAPERAVRHKPKRG